MSSVAGAVFFAFAVLFSFTLKAELVNQLTFNDSTDLMAATVGSAGAPYTKPLDPGSGNGNMTSVDDVDILVGVAGGAVKIPQNSFILFPHGVSADKADNWCMVMRVYLAKTEQSDTWFTPYSLDQDNNGDAFLFYRKDKGGWGCTSGGAGGWKGYTEEGSGPFGRWNTIVISVSEKVPTLYVNGVFLQTGNDSKQSLTDRANILIGGDNDGEDNDFYVDYVSVYDEAKPAEIFGAGDVPMLTDIPETVPLSAVYADPVVSGGTATFSADVVSLGGADSAQFKLAYAKVGETLPAATLVGTPVTAAGQLSYGLSGLENGAVYQYRIVVVDNEGKEAATAKEGSFLASDLLSIGPVYRPGLIQAKFSKGSVINGSPDSVKYPLPLTDILSRTDCEFDFTYGAFMGNFSADGTKTYQNPYSGKSWGWDSEYSAFMYEGEIYLRAGEKLVLYGRFDDGSSAVVNGTTMFDQHDAGDSGFNRSIDASKLQVFEVSDTGWYPIGCSVYDWSGGKVIKEAVSAVQYNLSGTKNSFVSTAIWSKLEDPGDGSLLRSKDTVTKFIQVARPVQNGSNVKVSAAFTGLPTAAVFYAYTSTGGDCGDNADQWEGKIKIADIAAGDTAMTEYDVAGLGAFPYVRFGIAAVTANPGSDVRCTTYSQLSSCVNFESEGFAVLVSSPNFSYESGSVAVTVAGFGEYTSLDLTLEVATDEEFSDIIYNQSVVSGVTTIGSYPVQIEGLAANTPYYFRVQITADGTPLEPTEATSYSTASYPPVRFESIVLEKAGADFGSFFFKVHDYGDRSAKADFCLEISESDDFSVLAASETVYEDLAVAAPFTRRATGYGLTASTAYYARVKAVNEKGSVSYTDVVAFTTPAQTDLQTIIWANKGTDFADPENFVEKVAPADNHIVFFDEPAIVQPYLFSNVTAYAVRFFDVRQGNSPALSSEDGYGGANFSGYVFTGAEDAELTLTANSKDDQVSNSAVAMFSTGTNRFEVPIHFGGNENEGHGIRVNGGVLDLACDLRADGDASQLRFAAQYEGRLRLGGDNSGFCGKCYLLDNCPRFEFYNPLAIAGFNYYYSSHWGGGGTLCGKTDDKTVHFINGCGCAVTNTVAELYEFGGNDGQRFEGAPMCFPNLSLKQTGNDNGYYVDTTLTIRRVLRNSTGGMSVNGTNGSNFINLEGLFNSDGSAVYATSYVVVKGGCYVAMTEEGLGGLKVVHASSWGNSWPSMGLGFDWNPAIGKESTSGGNVIGNDNGDRDSFFGWGAFGGDRTVTMFGDATRVVKCRESNDDVSFPGRIVFGSTAADGTLTLANSVDLNGGDRSFYLYDGAAYVDGRIRGDIITSNGKKLTLEGAGVLAIEGTIGACNLTTAGTGLLVNGTATGSSYTAKSGAFIGGTGTMEGALAVEGGGAVRPGELGGELTVKGNVSLASGATLKVDIAAGTNGCLKLSSETARKYTASGATVTINLLEGAPVDGLVKILDWSEATVDGTPTLFDPASYTLVFNEDEIVHPKLIRDDDAKALYLKYSAAKAGFTIFLK